MIVTILGSGTCVPSLKRSSCAVLVEIDGAGLLLDSGPGTMRRMLRADKTLGEMSHIFYSHFHPDHTSELVPFLFASKYPETAQRRQPLTLVAGRGFLDFFKGLQAVYGEWIDIGPGLLEIIELDNMAEDACTFDRFTVESMPVAHRKESLAYRITDSGGKSVVYSGDTDVCDRLAVIAKETDLFICESALPDALKTPGHLTPSRAGESAAAAKVKKLVLTHLYPECDTVDIEKECRRTFGGPLVVAEDLMRFTL